MEHSAEPASQRGPLRIPWWMGLCFFVVVATFFLWEEHRAHILGVLPYVLLLLCPIVHLFMHRGHGGHGGGHSERETQPHQHHQDGGTS